MIRVQPILQKLDTLGIDSHLRPRYLAVALGLKVSTKLPIPTSPVKSIEAHFIANFAMVVKTALDRFNEELVFPIDDTLDIVKDLYVLRYRFVHEMATFAADSVVKVLATATERGVGEIYQELIMDDLRHGRLSLLSRAIDDAYEGHFENIVA